MSVHSISISVEDVLKCIKKEGGCINQMQNVEQKNQKDSCSVGHHRRSEFEKNLPSSVQTANALKNGKYLIALYRE